MVVILLIIISVFLVLLCLTNPCSCASTIAHLALVECIDKSFLTFSDEAIESLNGIMIPQLAALLAICITVFVFLFTELNARAQDHPGERVICNELQKDFALRVERLSVESILLITLDYLANVVYGFTVNHIWLGHLLYALLVLASFWASICMIWYCVDVAQYQRHLNWRAWGLTKHRYNKLKQSYADTANGAPEYPEDVSNFWSEYLMVSQLVCTIAGEPQDQVEMSNRVIDRFIEVLSTGESLSQSGLSDALSDLYSYQLALKVLESYTNSDENSEHFGGAYSMPPVECFLKLLNNGFDKWNEAFHGRPAIDPNKIPGMTNKEGPLAARIARGLWRQIVQGDGCMYPMRSQRLYNMAFTGLNFAKGQLESVRMHSCRLVRSKFDRAELHGALFDDCDLRDSSFIDVGCSDLVFLNSNLDGITITDSSKQKANKSTATLVPRYGCSLVGLSFDGCSMVQASISTSEDEGTIDVSESVFSNADLLNATFCNAKLDRCTFKGTWLSGTTFNTCTGESVDFAGAQFIGATRNASLRNCEFKRSNLFGCVFSNAEIIGCDFPYLNAINTVYENVLLNDTSFVDASLNNASFLYVKMNNFSLEDTDLTNTRIVDPMIVNCTLLGSAGNGFQILNGIVRDTGFILAHLSAPEFSRTEFSDCRFEKSSLPRALFHRAELRDTKFSETLLPDADFSDTTLNDVVMNHVVATNALFDRVNFREVVIESSDFSHAMFRHATIENSRFNKCEWKSVSFASASLCNCNFATSSASERTAIRAALGQAHSLYNVMVDGEIVGQ